MPTYLSPGVYVEEVESGSRPIEGVGAAVAAFVGFAADGPFNAPTLVSNWSQLTHTFGDFVEGGYLAHAVYGFFANGGGAAYVVRVGQDGAGDGRKGRDLGAGIREASLGGYRVSELDGGGDTRAELTVEIGPPAPSRASRRHRRTWSSSWSSAATACRRPSTGSAPDPARRTSSRPWRRAPS